MPRFLATDLCRLMPDRQNSILRAFKLKSNRSRGIDDAARMSNEPRAGRRLTSSYDVVRWAGTMGGNVRLNISFFDRLIALLALLSFTQVQAQLLSDREMDVEVGAFTQRCITETTTSSTNLTKRGVDEGCNCIGIVFFKGLTVADLKFILSTGVSNQLVVNRKNSAVQYCRGWLEKQQASLPPNSLFFESSAAIDGGNTPSPSQYGAGAQTPNWQPSGNLAAPVGQTASINGMTCTMDAGGLFRCNNGVSCSIDAGGLSRCSDGSSSSTDSLGLTRFSDGTAATTNSGGLTRFSNGLTCDTDRMGLTRCNDGTTCSTDSMGLTRCNKK